MKKTIQFIYAFAFLFILSGCIKEEPDKETKTNPYGEGNGQYSFWIESDLGAGNIDIYVDGDFAGTISHFHANGITCGSADVDIIKKAGSYNWSGIGGNGTKWSGTLTFEDATCKTMKLTSSGGGGTSGYNCVNGNCNPVSDNAQYTTLTDCQNNCNGSGGYSLNDNWETSSGNGLTISGAQGAFYSFSSTWETYEDAGLVSIGDYGIKNIVKTSSNKWNCNTLHVYIKNQVPQNMVWSDDGVITMSSDGQSFTVVSNVTTDGSTKSATSVFYRK